MSGFKERVKEFEQEHDLADEISAELSYDPSIVGGDGVDVSAAEGIVTLEGEVDSLAQRVDHTVDIAVAFDDGTVTLRGTVHSWAERRDAEDSARLALGVRNVVDEVRVEP
jgi:osmotically-inducible protein OsmY